MKLFDTHCHLTDEKFTEDFDKVLQRMKDTGIELAVVIDDASREEYNAFRLAEQYDFLYAAVGLHPHDASKWSGDIENRIRQAMKHEKCVALGEIGLDYHYDLSPRDAQREVFRRQLELACELDKPAILHIREAHEDAYEILSSVKLPRCVMHCYGGTREQAERYLDMGMMISFSGSLTFKNTPELKETCTAMPLDRLMIETDSPYMAPIPMRGRRNEPAFVAYTAAKAAELKGISPDALAEAAFENGKRFFGIR